MSHAAAPLEESDHFHQISRDASPAAATGGDFSRVENVPAAPRVLARDDATLDARAAKSRDDFSAAPPRVAPNDVASVAVGQETARVRAEKEMIPGANAAGANAARNAADFCAAAPLRVLANDAAAFGVADSSAAENAATPTFVSKKQVTAATDEARRHDDSNAATLRVLAREGAIFEGANALDSAAATETETASRARMPASDDTFIGVNDANHADSRLADSPAPVDAPPRVLANNDATLGVIPAVNATADLLHETATRDANVPEDGDFGATVSELAPRVLASAHSASAKNAAPQKDDATLASRASFAATQNDEPSLLEIGAQIGPYEVQSHLGDGGMASVYRVWHTGLHRVEALKVPRQQGRFGPEAAFLRRLLAEARTVANLQHPNIAAIYAISDAASPLQFFSMEFIEGGDLAALLAERKSFAPSVALPILEQVAAALDYAHSQNVIHRDIKPANVLLQGSGENTVAKVVDFGISRAGEEAGGTRLTRSGMIVGTPEYMSPEQSGSGDDVTALTDEYSLGVLAYEMLCGVPPFVAGEGVSRLSLLMKHVGEAPQTPSHRVSGLPVAASDAIIRALSKKPEKRFASCGEFVATLRESLAGHDGIAPTPATLSGATSRHTRVFATGEKTMEIAPPEVRRRARLTALLAGVGGLVAGMMLVFGWLGYGRFPVTPMSTAAAVALPAKAPRESSPSRVVVQRETVKFQKVTRENATLSKGTKRVVQSGRAGTREVKLEISVKNGVQDVQRGIVKTLVAPRPEIVEIGTGEKVAAKKVALPKVALPPAAPTSLASTRDAQDIAKIATEAIAKRASVPVAKVVKASAERAATKRAAVKPTAEKPAIVRPKKAPHRAVKRDRPRRAASPHRRKSVRRNASTRIARPSTSHRAARSFGGSEAGLPP